MFRELKQLWDTFTCVGRLICPEGHVSSLNKSNPIQSNLSRETNIGAQKKFQHLTRAEQVVITRLRIGHTKATKSHILSRGPPTACHHCGQTLTIEHMLLECAVLQECRDEYYTVDSLNALFETIPETCIVEFLREAGFFYLIWCNLLTSTSPETWTIWSDLSGLFREWKQLWDTFTCVGRLLCLVRTCVIVKQIRSNQPISLETNTKATLEIPALNQSWGGCNYLTLNWPYQGPYLVPWTPNYVSPLWSDTDY